MSQDKDSRVEFHEWHTAKENKVVLQDLIEETVENVCDSSEELKSPTVLNVSVVGLVVRRLQERHNILPLGGPGYGRLHKVISDMYNLPPSNM